MSAVAPHFYADEYPMEALIQFRDIWFEGKHHSFNPDDLYALLILQKQTDKQVAYERAFRGWKSSPSINERRSDGRAFYGWLNKHKLSIIWKENDFCINPILTSPLAPRHDINDEMAHGHNFVIRPQMVDGRKIKLYVQDCDMIKILNLHVGERAPMEELTKGYIAQRLRWEKSLMPAPPFLDWLIALGKRPLIQEGDIGLFPQINLSSS